MCSQVCACICDYCHIFLKKIFCNEISMTWSDEFCIRLHARKQGKGEEEQVTEKKSGQISHLTGLLFFFL